MAEVSDQSDSLICSKCQQAASVNRGVAHHRKYTPNAPFVSTAAQWKLAGSATCGGINRRIKRRGTKCRLPAPVIRRRPIGRRARDGDNRRCMMERPHDAASSPAPLQGADSCRLLWGWFVCLLLLSGCVTTCDSAHSWQLYSVAALSVPGTYILLSHIILTLSQLVLGLS